MEKRILVAALLTIAFYFVYFKYFVDKPKTEEPASSPTTQSAPANPGAAAASGAQSAPVLGPTVQTANVAADKTYTIANDSIRFTFAARGAAVESVVLEGHLSHPLPKGGDRAAAEKLEFIRRVPDQPAPLALLDEFNPALGLEKVVWSSTGPAADQKSIAFSAEITDGPTRYRLTKTFRLADRPNRLLVDVTLEHLAGADALTRRYWLNTSGGCSMSEKTNQPVFHALVGVAQEGAVKIQAHLPNDILKQDTKQYDYTAGEIRFAGDMGVYFGAYLYATTKGGCDRARLKANDKTETVPASAYSQLGFLLITSAPGEKKTVTFDYYVGPKDRRNIEQSFEPGAIHDAYVDVAHYELNQQGCFCYNLPGISWLVQAVSRLVLAAISIFGAMFGSFGATSNMGFAIILLVLCVRIVMFPFNRHAQVTMQRHSEKMNKIKPQLDKLKEKYKADPQKLMSEQSKLMKENKMSYFPLGGCLPAFFQMPVFFGLWSAIRFDIDLRHARFLWCTDLSQPDNLIALAQPIGIPCCFPGAAPIITGLNILPLLMTAAWFFDTKTSMVKSTDPQIEQQQKMMQWMPLMFGIFMYGNAAGLSLYWLANSLIAMTEKRIVKKFFPIKKEDEVAVKPAAGK